MSWRCRRYHAALVDAADGRLGDRQQRRLKRHLAACAECRYAADALRDVPSELQSDTVPDPGEVFWRRQRDAIRRAIRALPEPHVSRRPFDWVRVMIHAPWLRPLAATATALLIAVLAYRVVERRPPAMAPDVSIAALDADVLAALPDLMRTLLPSDDETPPPALIDARLLSSQALQDLVGASVSLSIPAAPELSDTEIQSLDGLVGGMS